jgi:hypothetical protein
MLVSSLCTFFYDFYHSDSDLAHLFNGQKKLGCERKSTRGIVMALVKREGVALSISDIL